MVRSPEVPTGVGLWFYERNYLNSRHPGFLVLLKSNESNPGHLVPYVDSEQTEYDYPKRMTILVTFQIK